MSKELYLALAVKSMNDTASPNGLVPSLLLFGAMPPIPGSNLAYSSHFQSQSALEVARKEYEQIITKARVKLALTKRPRPAAKYRFYPQQSVYVYRENKKIWTGLPPVVLSDGKKVLMELGERTGPRSFNMSQVRPVRLPSVASLLGNTVQHPLGTSTIATSPDVPNT